MRQEAKDALQKYNVEAIQKFKASRNLNETELIHNVYEHIDNHEIPGLDFVQCAVQVQTNHGIVNLIMNEYAFYGRGHSIHSSGQIEWYTNTVYDKSVQVCGQQELLPLMDILCHWYVKVD